MSIEGEPEVRRSESEEVTASTVPVLTERRYSQLRRGILFRGRYWRIADASKGLLDVPVKPLAIMKQSEASFPRAESLGYRATIEGISPNASQLVHVLQNLGDFNFTRFHKDARYHLKKAINDPSIKIIKPFSENLDILVEQGVELHANSSAVHNYYYPSASITQAAFEVGLKASGFHSGELLIFAGLVEGKLAGFISGFAIDDTAIGETLIISDLYKGTDVGSRLIFAFIQAAQRTPGLDKIYNSRYEPLEPGISAYKERMGFPAIAVPMTVVLRPGLETFFHVVVKRLKPDLFIKLYGYK